MAHKKFYIRRTQGELIEEQTRLLDTFLSRPQSNYAAAIEMPRLPLAKEQRETISEPWQDEDDEPAYIPNAKTVSSIASLSLSTSRTRIDDEEVQKLKKIRADAVKMV